MTDTTWAEKVLTGVPRHNAQDAKNMTGYAAAVWLHEDAVVDAIAKLAEGDGLVERAEALREAAEMLGKAAQKYKPGTRNNETVKACGRAILALIDRGK